MAAALFEPGADEEVSDGHEEKPFNYAINMCNAAFFEAALDAGANPAGKGEAFRDAQARAQISGPAFAETRAYKPLLPASGQRD